MRRRQDPQFPCPAVKWLFVRKRFDECDVEYLKDVDEIIPHRLVMMFGDSAKVPGALSGCILFDRPVDLSFIRSYFPHSYYVAQMPVCDV